MMVDAGGAPSVDYARHDAETFRVAEELMMLSACVPSADKLTSSPSNISGFCDHVRLSDCWLDDAVGGLWTQCVCLAETEYQGGDHDAVAGEVTWDHLDASVRLPVASPD